MNLLQSSASPFNATSSSPISILGSTALLATKQDASFGVAGTAIVNDPVSNKTTNDQISLYIVHTGDTLPGIAKLFSVSVNTIIWANNIKGNKVTVGDELVILPISGVEYVVKSGDTVQSIAKKYKGDAGEIAQFNDISTDSHLSIGQTIIVPDGEISSEAGPASGNKKSNTKKGVVNSLLNGVNRAVNNGVGVSARLADSLDAPSDAPIVGQYSPEHSVYVGYFERPIIGGMKTQGIHGHNGVDLSSAYGTNILASADGQVIIAKSSGWNGGYGAYIVLKHNNGTQTLYAHLSQVDVSVGQDVSQGDIVGNMGNSGDSTGTHLHFEIRGAVNPF